MNNLLFIGKLCQLENSFTDSCYFLFNSLTKQKNYKYNFADSFYNVIRKKKANNCKYLRTTLILFIYF